MSIFLIFKVSFVFWSFSKFLGLLPLFWVHFGHFLGFGDILDIRGAF